MQYSVRSNNIKVLRADTPRRMDDFVRLPHRLYKGIKQYVPDLDSDIRSMISSQRNGASSIVEIQPFVAYRGNEAVGRIAGVINPVANRKWNKRQARFSLIEFEDDADVAQSLLEAVEEWGRGRGMTEIAGPLGATDFDKEGMLIEDFDMQGTLVEYWNPEYYKHHMERLGYEKAVDWVHVRVNVPAEVPARYARVAAYVRETFGLRVVKKSKHEVQQGYGRKFFRLLNEAYAPLYGFSSFTEKQADDFVKLYMPLLDMDLIPFVENADGELVCAAVTFRDISGALQKAHGRLLPWGWCHFMKALFWQRPDKAEMLLIAVRPDLQGLGLNALIFDELIPIYNRKGIKWAETGPQLENNIKELSQWKPLKPELVKRRRCWYKAISTEQ